MKKNSPYSVTLFFNQKKFTINIIVDRVVEGRAQCDFEIFTTEKMSGCEFQKLKKYLESEGYVDQAFEMYKNKQNNIN